MYRGLRDYPIRIAGPSITEKEIRYVTDAAANAWYGDANMYHGRFEAAFADYLGTGYAVALPSCTSAIHLSLLALGVGQGDEVIVPDLTWIASAAPVAYVGATPVFADVDLETWCISAASLEACVTPRTRAVIPVDLYGGMPDLEAIQDIAKEHGIPIIEDAAEAMGSSYHGPRAGSFGTTGVFSFHGSKTMTTGEGGMLVTNDDRIHERVLFLRDHGRPPGDRMFFNTEVAYKYKMSALQAALGLAQLERIDELVRRKREIFSWYADRLQSMQELTLNAEPPGTTNSYWMVTVLIDTSLGKDKTALMEEMSERRVECRPFFNPLSSLPAYAASPDAEKARRRNTVSYEISPFGLNLPSGLDLNEEDVDYVCNCLLDILGR